MKPWPILYSLIAFVPGILILTGTSEISMYTPRLHQLCISQSLVLNPASVCGELIDIQYIPA